MTFFNMAAKMASRTMGATSLPPRVLFIMFNNDRSFNNLL